VGPRLPADIGATQVPPSFRLPASAGWSSGGANSAAGDADDADVPSAKMRARARRYSWARSSKVGRRDAGEVLQPSGRVAASSLSLMPTDGATGVLMSVGAGLAGSVVVVALAVEAAVVMETEVVVSAVVAATGADKDGEATSGGLVASGDGGGSASLLGPAGGASAGGEGEGDGEDCGEVAAAGGGEGVAPEREPPPAA